MKSILANKWIRLCSPAALAIPTIVRAEPGVSSGHVPFLVILATGLAALLFAVFMLFLVPLIVAFGSILITGRTM